MSIASQIDLSDSKQTLCGDRFDGICIIPIDLSERWLERRAIKTLFTTQREKGMFEMEMTPASTMDLAIEPTTTAAAAAPARTAKAQSKVAGEKLAAEMAVFASVVGELRGKIDVSGTFEDRCKSVVSMASELFGVAPTWTAFYREVLGAGGIARSFFNEIEERQAYEATDSHSQIFEMLTALRSRDLPENDPTEPQRMITIRLPMTLHNAICDEANELEVSVNKLCISRMLQQLDDRMIPACKNKRRGRRPGASPSGKPAIDVVG